MTAPGMCGLPVFWDPTAQRVRVLSGMHLQWFAAEDEGRTEEPTEHKIRKAREEGKVAKSVEVVAAIELLFSVLTIGLLAAYLLNTMVEMVRFFFSKAADSDISRDGTLMYGFVWYFVRLTAPVALVAFFASIAGNVMQVGLLFTVKPITPDLSRIVPRFGRFFQRALFSGEALFNLAKSVVKVAVIVAIAFVNIMIELPAFANLVRVTYLQSFAFVAQVGFRILVEAAVALLFLSLFDYLFQRRLHIESLKMSRQEVTEERKMHEGDPLIKSRLRERMRQLLRRNMLASVPKATVVVTNPTHFAVALQYTPETMPSPMVTAKGMDHVAQAIRRVATEARVPVVENKPLARALHADLDIGDYIPEKYYQAVAAVIREVHRLGEASRMAG